RGRAADTDGRHLLAPDILIECANFRNRPQSRLQGPRPVALEDVDRESCGRRRPYGRALMLSLQAHTRATRSTMTFGECSVTNWGTRSGCATEINVNHWMTRTLASAS